MIIKHVIQSLKTPDENQTCASPGTMDFNPFLLDRPKSLSGKGLRFKIRDNNLNE